MDTRTLFRNLVTGKYIGDLDYSSGQLSFQTVFHSSPNDYCCCICSYEHEFIDYIAEDGTIDEEMYNKVLENILNGACPHVTSAPPEFVTETSVYGIHVASVAGPLRAVKKYCHNYLYKRGKVFERDPCQTAILKNRTEYVDIFYKARVMGCSLCNSNSSWKKYLLYGTRTGVSDQIQFWYTPVVGFCAKQRNSRMTKTVLNSFTAHNPNDIAKLLELTFKTERKDTQRAVLKYLEKKNKRMLVNCAKVAILYDQPYIFAHILELMSQIKTEGGTTQSFSEIFSLLQRDASQAYLARSRYKTPYKIADTQLSFTDKTELRMNLVTTLIDTFPDVISDQMIASFKDVIQRDAIDGTPGYQHESLISAYIDSLRGGHNSYSDDGVPYKDKVNALVQLGGDIDYVGEIDYFTPLSCLLKDREFEYLTRSRELLEVLIYENSSLQSNTTAVSLAINRERNMRDVYSRSKRLRYPGKFLLDARVHPYYGHDDATNFVLNFTGPLLIECGYPVERSVL